MRRTPVVTSFLFVGLFVGLFIGLLDGLVLRAQNSAPRAAPIQAPRQEAPVEKEGKDFTLKVDVDLVTLPVSVLNKDGVVVNNLAQNQFQVLENNIPQDIAIFKHEDIPLSLGLVIDNSGSMRNKRERVNSAALTFVKEGNPDDETFIINFDDAAYLEQDFTGSIGDLVDALDTVDTRGETALNDAIFLSLDHVKQGTRDKKALLVVSDGEDNASKYGFNKILEHARESRDVTIYAIGLLEDNDQRGGLFRKSPSKKAREGLIQLAEATGGLAFFPKSLDEVEEICQRIAHDLRNQYTLAYSPKNKLRDGAWREIRVLVTPPKGVSKISVRTKPGYYAPSPAPLADPAASPE